MKFIVYSKDNDIVNKSKEIIAEILPSSKIDVAENGMECFTIGVLYDYALITENNEGLLWKDLMMHLSSKGVKVVLITNNLDENVLRDLKEAKGETVINQDNIEEELKNIILKLKEKSEAKVDNIQNDDKIEEALTEIKTIQDFSLLRSKKYPAVIVSIHGAKGGVGKTSIAVNVAVMLAKKGLKVAAIDLDVENGNMVNVLHMNMEKDLKDIIKGNSNYTDTSFEQHSSGLYVLPSLKAPAESEMITADVCERIMGRLARVFDVIVIDTGCLEIDPMLVSMQLSTLSYFVTNADMTVVARTHELLEDTKVMGIDIRKIKMIINRMPKKSFVNKSQIAEYFDIPILTEIPEEEEVLAALNNGQVPVEVGSCSKYTEGIKKIVDDIIKNTDLAAKMPEDTAETSKKGGKKNK